MRFRRRVPRLGVEAVRDYPPPSYPTIEAYAAHPEWLLAEVPQRWRNSRVAMGALTAFVLSGTAREVLSEAPRVEAPLAPAGARGGAAGAPETRAREAHPSVAPVFIHGEGRGATGCVVISPPVFLSESEALEIIWQELEQENLGFEPRATRCPTRAAAGESRPLYFDAYSPRYRCGVAFVGGFNYSAMREALATPSRLDPLMMSSVQDYDNVGVAQELVEKLRSHAVTNAGVFYDPLVTADRATPGRARTQSSELLRAQVREFVEWVKRSLVAADAPRPRGR